MRRQRLAVNSLGVGLACKGVAFAGLATAGHRWVIIWLMHHAAQDIPQEG